MARYKFYIVLYCICWSERCYVGDFLQLAMENHRLRQELNDLKCQQSLLDDDRVLDSIEHSFHQFHAFLDMLRDAG